MKVNKRKLFIFISTVLLLVFVFSSVLITKANNVIVFEDVKNCKSVVVNNNMFISSIKENSITLQGVSDNSLNYNFTLNNTPDCVQYSDTGFCAVEIVDNAEDKTICNINIGSIDDDYMKFRNFIFPFDFDKTDIAIDNNLNTYTANCTVSNEIYVFSKHGDLTAKITADEVVNQLLYFKGQVLAFCESNVYAIEGTSLKPLFIRDIINTPVTITGVNSICDNNGELFLSDNNMLTLIADFNSNCLCFKAENYILAVSGNEIYGNDINNPNITASYSLSITPDFVYYAEPYIYAGGYSGDNYVIEKLQVNQLNINEIQDTTAETKEPTQTATVETLLTTEPTDFTETTEVTEPTDATEATDVTEPTGTTENTQSTESTTVSNTLTYSSDVYEIIQQNHIIANVVSKTTVTQFKKNINCNGDITILNKNYTKRTSGYIGTGMKAIFSLGDENVEYTISVKGDLTGEGNVNTIDIDKMFDFRMELDTPTLAQVYAVDFNNNGTLTNVDLLLHERLRLALKNSKS